ncbi:MAG TPA: hypothetical protein VJ965_11075, partial [Anaerolineales bacterium]|nr:hypothetical protein [Anaerolineales bacterium]
MKSKTIFAILLIVLFILSSCTSDVPAPLPTDTFTPTQTSPLTPVVPTITPTPLPATATPTSAPTSTPTEPLSESGPWLVYLHNIPEPSYYNHAAVLPELIVLNQDGSGRTSIIVPECGKDNLDDFFMNSGNSVRYMVQVDSAAYIIQPSDAAGQVVYRPWGILDCGTEFSGGDKHGFVTRFYSDEQPIPSATEMILFELPSGEIREQFTLFRCEGTPDVCHKASLFWTWDVKTKPAWSP